MDTQVFSHWIGTLRGTTARLEPSGPFVLAGIEWASPQNGRVELRARSRGRWTPWALASVQGHDSDGGESASHAHFGEPVWTGPATELQLRSDRLIEGLTVHVVSADVLEQTPAGRALASLSRERVSGTGPFPAAKPVLSAGPGQPPIIARSAWAGTRGPATPPGYGDVRMMFVHHSDNANGYSAAEVPGMLLSIYQFHRYVRGWNDIGYNFAVDAYGRIWEARAGGIDQAVVGAQAGGYNLESSGAVMLGTFSGALPTQAALASLQRLLAWKLSLHGVPVSGTVTVEVDPTDAFYTRYRPGERVTLPRIAGHRDGCTTDCPGAVLYAHLPAVRANVRRVVRTQLALTLGFDANQSVTPAGYLSLASAQIVAGQSLALGGLLTEQTPAGGAGAPVPNAPVEIQSLLGQAEGVLTGTAQATDGTVGAVGPLMLSTGADGRFSAEFSPVHNVLVRALHAEPSAVASPLLAVAVAPAVTLELDTTTTPVLTGTVTPRTPKIEILAYHASGRHALAHSQTIDVQTDGSFRHTPKLASGAYLVRAVTAADAYNVAGESPRISLTV